jgi:hypothetical protein
VRFRWLAVVAVLALPSCGDEVSDRPVKGRAPLRECQEIWVDGKRLPDDYRACRRDGRVVEPTLHDCTRDVGNQLVIHRGLFFAVWGGEITEVRDGPRSSTTVAC